ncbi:MAG: DUF192 domain-containing protein [Acidimicrobiales bacterium]
MAWLLRDDEVLASLEIPESRHRRARGLLGRDTFEGAMLLSPTRSVHTIGMRFPIDVAYCDGDLCVVAVVTMSPNRVGMPRPRARSVIEAEAGAFERWSLTIGQRLEVRE